MARVKVRAPGGRMVLLAGDAAPDVLAGLAGRLWALTEPSGPAGAGFGFVGGAEVDTDIAGPDDPDVLGEPDADPDVLPEPARPVRPLPDPYAE